MTAYGAADGHAVGVRQNAIFYNGFKVICPVQSRLQKDFGFHLGQITGLSLAIPCPSEGRFAIVTDVGRGERWTQKRF